MVALSAAEGGLWKGAWTALIYLLVAFVVRIVHEVSEKQFAKSNPYLTALSGTAIILVVALLAPAAMPQETECPEEDSSCDFDAGRPISSTDRWKAFGFVLTVLGVPFVVAASRRFGEKRQREVVTIE